MHKIIDGIDIALIELNYHQECVYSLCQLLEHSNHHVAVFTTNKIYQEVSELINKDRVHWVIIKEQESEEEFLTANIDQLNRHQVVFFNTLDCEIEFINSLNLTAQTWVRIHNVNTFLNRLSSIDFSLRKRFLVRYCLQNFIIKKRFRSLDNFLKNVDLLLFPDEPIAAHAAKVGKMNLYQQSAVFPLSFFCEKEMDFEKMVRQMNSRKIIIPGIVDANRKDYDTLFEALKMLKDSLTVPVEVMFLGGLQSWAQSVVKEKFLSIADDLLIVSFSDGKVSQKVYKETAEQSGFMISPTKDDTRFKIFKEKYGKTKMSGSVSDVIRYGKPLIIPETYALNTTLSEHIAQYDNAEELLELILVYLEKDFLIDKHRRLWDGLESYNIENSLDTFNQLIKHV